MRRAILLASLLVSLAGLISGWLVFFESRSASPSAFGAYSPRLFAFVLAYGVLIVACAGFLFLPRRGWERRAAILPGRLVRAGALPEILLFGAPLPLVLFFWLGRRFTPLSAEHGIRLAAILTYAGFLLACISSMTAQRLKKLALRGVLTLMSGLFTLLLLELALRIISPGSVFTPAFDMRPHVRVRIDAAGLAGVSPVGTYSTNKWGMRGDEPPSDWGGWTTLVCVGGSTTQCFELDDHKTWPWLLQEDLRRAVPHVWVGNGGISGTSTMGHILFMQDVISVTRPDIVIFLIGNNEKFNYVFGTNPSANSIARQRTSLSYRLFCASRLLQVLYSMKKAWFDEIPVLGTPWASSFEPQPLRGPEIEIPEDLHDLLRDPDMTRNNVRRLISLARGMGVTPVFLTQPMLFEDTPYWRSVERVDFAASDTSVVSAATWWRLLDMDNRDIMEVCAEESVACYDLASVVPHDRRYFFDDVHFSEAGAALVADSVSAFLLRAGLVR